MGDLTCKQLNMKLLMLLLICTGRHRCDIRCIRVSQIRKYPDRFDCYLMEATKTYSYKNTGSQCVQVRIGPLSEAKLCPYQLLNYYLSVSQPTCCSDFLILRSNMEQIASNDCLRHWIWEILQMAGAMRESYSGNTRHTTATHCLAKGFSVDEIMCQACWVHPLTMYTHYIRPRGIPLEPKIVLKGGLMVLQDATDQNMLTLTPDDDELPDSTQDGMLSPLGPPDLRNCSCFVDPTELLDTDTESSTGLDSNEAQPTPVVDPPAEPSNQPVVDNTNNSNPSMHSPASIEELHSELGGEMPAGWAMGAESPVVTHLGDLQYAVEQTGPLKLTLKVDGPYVGDSEDDTNSDSVEIPPLATSSPTRTEVEPLQLNVPQATMMTLVPFSTDLLKLNPGPEPGPMGTLAPCTHQTFGHWPAQILPPQNIHSGRAGGPGCYFGGPNHCSNSNLL